MYIFVICTFKLSLFILERLKMPLTDSTNNHFSQIIDLNQKQPKIKYGILKEVKINCSLPNQEYIKLKC